MQDNNLIVNRDLGIYLHIPFCIKKCSYCDFYSQEYFSADILRRYVEQMCRELTFWSAELGNMTIQSVYFGGGTPSLLEVAEVEKIMLLLEEKFRLANPIEISMEANPNNLSVAKLVGYKNTGVNRISLGAQSFLPDELKLLGRTHTVEDIVTTVDNIRTASIDNFNLDLIYGLPAQTVEKFSTSLQRACALEPEHLSLYLLQLEAGVPLARRIASGQFCLPEDEVLSDLYYYAGDFLLDAGYEHYEISNWAKPGRQCRHNLIYWQSLPYLGVGSSAVSFLENKRFQSSQDIAGFMDPERSFTDRLVLENMNDKEKFSDFLLMALRLSAGIDKEATRRRFGRECWEPWKDKLAECKTLGLLEEDEKRWFLSERGKFLSNQVFVRLLP